MNYLAAAWGTEEKQDGPVRIVVVSPEIQTEQPLNKHLQRYHVSNAFMALCSKESLQSPHPAVGLTEPLRVVFDSLKTLLGVVSNFTCSVIQILLL
jgi:hypothetical protein